MQAPESTSRIDITDFLLLTFTWWDYMEGMEQHCSRLASNLRRYQLSLATDPIHRKKIFELITLLEDAIPWFRLRGFELTNHGLRPSCMPDIQRSAQVCSAAAAALSVYWGDEEYTRGLCLRIVGDAKKWIPFSQALTENRLRAQKDWRDARSPYLWLSTTTANIAANDPQDYQAPEVEEMVPVEEIAEIPAEAVLERHLTFRSIAELQAAAEADPEMREYVCAKINYPDWNCDQIWNELGWDEKRGKAVDRRYRRLRRRVKDLGAGMEWRTAPMVSGTGGSVTTYFETLYDGAEGAETGTWQHMEAIPPESLPIAPFRPDPFPARGFNLSQKENRSAAGRPSVIAGETAVRPNPTAKYYALREVNDRDRRPYQYDPSDSWSEENAKPVY